MVKNILITGGTSGLGLELTGLFLAKGYNVVITGRKTVHVNYPGEKLTFFQVDFGNLSETAATIKLICNSYKFDYVINNAGIFSPFRYTSTTDGHEYTFQVNFLSHLLINEIIIRNQLNVRPFTTVMITSPVYRFIRIENCSHGAGSSYKPFKAYAESKFFMVLMSRHFAGLHKDSDLISISFNPGTFSSHIFRMQNNFFRALYLLASPFMRKPSKVASVLVGILEQSNLQPGSVYNLKKGPEKLKETCNSSENNFWLECYKILSPYLNKEKN